MTAEIDTPVRGRGQRWSNKLIDDSCPIVAKFFLRKNRFPYMDKYNQTLPDTWHGTSQGIDRSHFSRSGKNDFGKDRKMGFHLCST